MIQVKDFYDDDVEDQERQSDENPSLLTIRRVPKTPEAITEESFEEEESKNNYVSLSSRTTKTPSNEPVDLLNCDTKVKPK